MCLNKIKKKILSYYMQEKPHFKGIVLEDTLR